MPLAEEISNLKELQQFVIFKRNESNVVHGWHQISVDYEISSFCQRIIIGLLRKHGIYGSFRKKI